MSQLTNVLRDDGLFFLEARSSKDEGLNKIFGDSHYRRYLNFDKTIKKLEDMGLVILEKEESRGLARYKDEDPFVLRVVARNRA